MYSSYFNTFVLKKNLQKAIFDAILILDFLGLRFFARFFVRKAFQKVKRTGERRFNHEG